jgi:hypothetical protein
MRILTVGAALAAALLLAGQTHAQFPSNVHTRAPAGNSFDLGIQRFIALLKPGATTASSSSSSSNTPVPIARPQVLSARNLSLASFLGKPTLPSGNSTIHGFSTYPSQDQLPGAAYLKAFGARIPPRVQLDN